MNVSTDCVLVNEMLQDERDELYERLVLLRKRTGMSVRSLQSSREFRRIHIGHTRQRIQGIVIT